MRIVKCPEVKGDRKERVAYDSAKAAILACRNCDKKYEKISKFRYCLPCDCWHITTKGSKEYQIELDYNRGSVFVSEGLFERNIDELAREAENARNVVRTAYKYRNIIEISPNAIGRGAYYLRGLLESHLIENKEEEGYLLQSVVSRESVLIKKLFDKIESLLGDLESCEDYKEKRLIRDEIKSLINREPYIFYIFPDKKEEYKKRCLLL